jgi:hypothetical protein
LPAPVLSLTEENGFIAIREFLLGTVLSSNRPLDVIRGQQNLTSEPSYSDFIIVWPLFQRRLSTNIVTEYDNTVLGYINNDIMTVTDVTNGSVVFGQLVRDVFGSLENIVVSTQLSGTPQGVGTYQLSNARSVPNDTLYIGERDDWTPTQWTVQLDVHGPNSGNNAKVIEGLFRSEVATKSFADSGYDMAPLYCEEARYLPFINAEQQVEYRWTLDLYFHTNPIIKTSEQFADKLHTDLKPVDILFIAE